MFNETLRTSPVSELSFSTTASTLPVDEATRSNEELYAQWMSPFFKEGADESGFPTDSASPPLPLPRVEHGPSAAMHAKPVDRFQVLLATLVSTDQPTKENQLCLPDSAADAVLAVRGEAPTA